MASHASVDLKAYRGAHSPTEPLNSLDQARQNMIYAGLANWVVKQLPPQTADRPLRRVGPRVELAIALRARRDHWEHRFSLPARCRFCPPHTALSHA